ncbi:uncharacterized protein DC041_0011416 [Schistosoma bovis]|uniref:Caffeoyl-CoA O-methyltransferase n=1 Tax=Schistosoma bovis TaxID=6184 RepID=A0A430Q8G7_SCHBO|nr:uncharacterized protein DC041_0011416 [Schistosoma bovis]
MTDLSISKSVTEYGCTKSADKLHQYICDHSLRLSEAQKWLLQESRKHPLSLMLFSSIEMQLLSNLCYAINARKTLDVGVYTGYSALSIAEVLPSDGRVVALDKTDEYLKDYCLPAWKKAGVESKIDFRLGPALQTLRKFDNVVLWSQFVLDENDNSPATIGIREMNALIARDNSVRISLLRTGDGLTIVVKN